MLSTEADMPGRRRLCSGPPGSTAIFTGMRCMTLTKLPVALSGGRRVNCGPLAGEKLSMCPGAATPEKNPLD
jgi:hypothetical protein